MIKWMLFIWLCGEGNRNVIPTLAATYSTQEKCLQAKTAWETQDPRINPRYLIPMAKCLPSQ